MKYSRNFAKTFFCLLILASAFSVKAAADEKWASFKKNGVTFEYRKKDKEQAQKIAGYVEAGSKTIENFFGEKFSNNFTVRIYPDRKTLTEFWLKDWNEPALEPQCWMVASGTSKMLTILSPGVWSTEACEHNAADEEDTQLLITHEMVHVFHAQMNPKPNFEGMDAVAWFVEGLAVYASGQLESEKLARPREAVERDRAPSQLENAWSGKYRYGVAGSIIKFIDKKYGRQILLKMLKGTTEG